MLRFVALPGWKALSHTCFSSSFRSCTIWKFHHCFKGRGLAEIWILQYGYHRQNLLPNECTPSGLNIVQSKIRKKEFCLAPAVYVTLRAPPPPLDFETGWTGELWSKTNLPNWQNLENSNVLLKKSDFWRFIKKFLYLWIFKNF